MNSKQSTEILAREYYELVAEKNLEALALRLHPEVEFSGFIGVRKGKASVFAAIRDFTTAFDKLDVCESLGGADRAVVIYEVSMRQPASLKRMSALLTFSDDLIAKIELFCPATNMSLL